ncbi:MAG: YchF family ATPase [Proteobacteria bacterium]|nr:YchF family ATPase [Pseudomonadota bacterium]MBU1709019.1 YchF family ATPase [Pseudomonadota bacterium]
MKLGIIGLPGAGKSTLFEALTGIIQDDAAHKPEDRIGTITVPDKRVDILSDMYKPKKTMHARVEYLLPYIAAHDQGRKKEETAWTTVRTCDAIIHVVRNFKGYGEEAPQPLKDFTSMNEEMIFADLMVVEKRLERLELDAKRGRDVNLEEQQLLKQCKELLDNETPLRTSPELASEHLLKGFTFLSARPMLVVFNNQDDDDALPDVGEIAQQEKCLVVRCSLEHELTLMQPDEALEYLEEYGITVSAMDLMISFSYELLGLISFFTVGEDEVRAWTIRKNIDAVDAAEVIHSDIKKGFIRAEVVAYDDLMEAGSRNEAKKKGTVRLEGKTYQVQDGDIIEFRFNV